MFGETDYDPRLQFTSVPLEEQLEALERAVNCGKVKDRFYINNFKEFSEEPYGLTTLIQYGHSAIPSSDC